MQPIIQLLYKEHINHQYAVMVHCLELPYRLFIVFVMFFERCNSVISHCGVNEIQSNLIESNLRLLPVLFIISRPNQDTANS